MKKQTIVFTNDDCKGIRMLDRDLFMQYIRDFGPNVKCKLTIEHYFPQRSLNQNGAMHWWIDLLAEELNIEPEKLKELLKYKYLKRPLLNKHGEELVDENTREVEWYVPSTSELDKAEMVAFMDNIHVFGLEFAGIDLPLPDKNYKMNFLENNKKLIQNEKTKG